MANIELAPLTGETEKHYLWRLGQSKDNELIEISWEEIAELINTYYRENGKRVEAGNIQKRYSEGKQWFNEFSDFIELNNTDTIVDSLTEVRESIIKEKQSLRDERVALNKVYREHSRVTSFAELVIEQLDNYEFPVYDYCPNPVHLEGESDLIIHLTDLHCGNETKSPFNTYNTDMVKDRLDKYLDNIYSIKNTHFAENAYVILGGDLIQGLIHVNSRIEAKEDVVNQIIYATEYISNFIYQLSQWFNEVKIYSVTGNHGRAVASKEESIRKENFDRLVTWGCSKELAGVKNVSFEENTLDVDIANFEVRGWNIWATHGDKDTPSNVVNNFTNFARHLRVNPPDVCYLGHRHCNGLSTHAGIKVVESGSTMGMDNYCVGRRLCGWPEQTVTVVTTDKALTALYDITLN